jgi:transposase
MSSFPNLHSVLVLDNVRTHHNAAFLALLRAHGIRVVYTPRYMPEYNPIERVFSEFKAAYRRHGAYYHHKYGNGIAVAAKLFEKQVSVYHFPEYLRACGIEWS